MTPARIRQLMERPTSSEVAEFWRLVAQLIRLIAWQRREGLR
jgi:hypothetical protein